MSDRDCYKPLGFEQIVDLLIRGRQALADGRRWECWCMWSRIEDGIWGITCPYPVDGPVADALEEVEDLLYEWTTSSQVGDEKASLFGRALLVAMRKAMKNTSDLPR